MPLLEIEIVEAQSLPIPDRAAQLVADAAGSVLQSEPGRTWVRIRRIQSEDYAENLDACPEDAPVFVKLIEASPPSGKDLESRIAELCRAIASSLGRAPCSIHILYEPPALGRIAFGGLLRK